MVSEKKVDASIPFYEIQSMVCKQYEESRMVEKSSYGGSNYFTLNTGDKFSIEEGNISNNLQPQTDLLQYFTVQIKDEKSVRNRTTIFTSREGLGRAKKEAYRRYREKASKRISNL